MKSWARRRGLTRAQCGAVVAIQRFTKTLSISPHLHVLVLDGVFLNDDDGVAMRFIACPPPTAGDLLDLAKEVLEKLTRFLEKGGYLLEHAEDDRSLTDRWFLRGLAEPSMFTPSRIVGSALEYGGFSIHAGVTVAQGDKRGREQLCRYVTRPGFAEDQLRMTDDGRVELTLRKPSKNGQRIVLLEPLALLRRLSWLVPPPRQHQLRYSGILASAAKQRREVVPRPPPQIQLAFPIENMRPERQTFRLSWAKLLARVYNLDAERCPKCGGRLRPIGAVTDPPEAQRHLARLEARNARGPPQLVLSI